MAKQVRCNRCQATNVAWRESRKGTWFLVNPDGPRTPEGYEQYPSETCGRVQNPSPVPPVTPVTAEPANELLIDALIDSNPLPDLQGALARMFAAPAAIKMPNVNYGGSPRQVVTMIEMDKIMEAETDRMNAEADAEHNRRVDEAELIQQSEKRIRESGETFIDSQVRKAPLNGFTMETAPNNYTCKNAKCAANFLAPHPAEQMKQFKTPAKCPKCGYLGTYKP